jgi:hypothetical protein
MRWLERYVIEGIPNLQHPADVAADLARQEA